MTQKISCGLFMHVFEVESNRTSQSITFFAPKKIEPFSHIQFKDFRRLCTLNLKRLTEYIDND